MVSEGWSMLQLVPLDMGVFSLIPVNVSVTLVPVIVFAFEERFLAMLKGLTASR
jgi:hypothetical protein